MCGIVLQNVGGKMVDKRRLPEEYKAERLEKIIEMIADDRSMAYVGRKLNISRERIRQILKEHGEKQQQES